MSDTIFVNAVTLTDADWFNDVNRLHYTIFGDPATAAVAARALQNKGADIASAGTLDLSSATGDFVHITGTTTITAITLSSGKEMTLVFDGILTLTYNATTLILPTSANITTAAGDTAVFRGDGSGNVRCISYIRRTGAPLTFGVTHANGGIVYSTASALAVSAVGSSGQILRSGGAGAPTWSTATYPATVTANQLLYASATNAVASANNTTYDGITLTLSGNGGLVVSGSYISMTSSVAGFKVEPVAVDAYGALNAPSAKDSYLHFSVNAANKVWAVGADYTDSEAFVVSENPSLGTANRMKIAAGGDIFFPGHGTTASAANAYLDSGTGNLLRSTSSLRYKRDVEPIDPERINSVLNLDPIWYRSKCEGDNPNWSWYGLSAEQVAELDPRLVHWGKEVIDENEYGEKIFGETLVPEGVMYERISVMLLGVVKNQQKEIQSLKDEVAAIKATLGV